MRHITLWRVAFLFAMIAVLSKLTLTDWGSWAAIIAAVVAVGLVLVGFIRWIVRRFLIHRLFTPEYQPSEESKAATHTTYASNTTQRVHTTLRFGMDSHIEFVAVLFKGDGILPKIEGLDDWHYNNRGRPPNVIQPYPVPNTKDGRWYWYYQTPHHRRRKSRITIGIDYLATGFFNGRIAFEVTAAEGGKQGYLPFKVIAEASGGDGDGQAHAQGNRP